MILALLPGSPDGEDFVEFDFIVELVELRILVAFDLPEPCTAVTTVSNNKEKKKGKRSIVES